MGRVEIIVFETFGCKQEENITMAAERIIFKDGTEI